MPCCGKSQNGINCDDTGTEEQENSIERFSNYNRPQSTQNGVDGDDDGHDQNGGDDAHPEKLLEHSRSGINAYSNMNKQSGHNCHEGKERA